MSGFSSWGIFLSYRREDTAPYARLLQFQLRERLPDVRVFMDLDSIEAGLDFAEVIREAVDSCAVLVALIGRQWVTLADEEGHPRLDDPDDLVRLEVQTALERGVRVIPVLVDSARPLRQQQLPAELCKLARLNALELSYGRYQYDADRLLDHIQRMLAAPPRTGTAHQSPPAATAEALAARPDGNTLGEAAQKDIKAVRIDPARAARLLPDTERIAQSITNESVSANPLFNMARAPAVTEPDRAAQPLVSDVEQALKSAKSSDRVADVVATSLKLVTSTSALDVVVRAAIGPLIDEHGEVNVARLLRTVAHGLSDASPSEIACSLNKLQEAGKVSWLGNDVMKAEVIKVHP